MTFADWLELRRADADFRIWADGRDIVTLWRECPNPEWMMWLLWAVGYRGAWMLRDKPADCLRQTVRAETVLAYWEDSLAEEEARNDG